jgi:hypothetical protein
VALSSRDGFRKLRSPVFVRKLCLYFQCSWFIAMVRQLSGAHSVVIPKVGRGEKADLSTAPIARSASDGSVEMTRGFEATIAEDIAYARWFRDGEGKIAKFTVRGCEVQEQSK